MKYTVCTCSSPYLDDLFPAGIFDSVGAAKETVANMHPDIHWIDEDNGTRLKSIGKYGQIEYVIIVETPEDAIDWFITWKLPDVEFSDFK